MSLVDFDQKIPLDAIVIEREGRQRRKIANVESLAESIRRDGLINPIIIQRDGNKLVAGERRLTAFKHLHEIIALAGTPPAENPYRTIPFRYLDSLDPIESKRLELAENAHREALPWQDRALSIAELHDLFLARDPAWPATKTADELGFSSSFVANHLMVAREMQKGNKLVAEAENFTEACNKARRVLDRAVGEEFNVLLAGNTGLEAALRERLSPTAPSAPPQALASGASSPVHGSLGTASGSASEKTEAPQAPTAVAKSEGDAAKQTPAPLPPPPPKAVLNADFLEWAETYTGQPFNLIHCDFPYGINHQKTKQGRIGEYGSYDDSEDVYWALLKGLARNKAKLIYPSAHIIFWYSMKHHAATVDFFQTHFPEFTFDEMPLIWWKDRSIAPDTERRPRRVYETALFGFSGNRKLVNTRSNLTQFPCGNKQHVSEKPAGMLLKFFRMVVDRHTRLLDPTCGAGSALRAAKALEASHVLGLERDPEFARIAQEQYDLAQTINFAGLGKDEEDEK